MKGLIADKNIGAISAMIKQLRTAYADPSYSDFEKGGFLWLGRRYQEGYEQITGKPFSKAA